MMWNSLICHSLVPRGNDFTLPLGAPSCCFPTPNTDITFPLSLSHTHTHTHTQRTHTHTIWLSHSKHTHTHTHTYTHTHTHTVTNTGGTVLYLTRSKIGIPQQVLMFNKEPVTSSNICLQRVTSNNKPSKAILLFS